MNKKEMEMFSFTFICSACKAPYVGVEIGEHGIASLTTKICPLCSNNYYKEISFVGDIGLFRLLIKLLDACKTTEMLAEEIIWWEEMVRFLETRQKGIDEHKAMWKEILDGFDQNKDKLVWWKKAQKLQPFTNE